MVVWMVEGLPKPRIFASRCLGFAKCRYNGATIPSRIVGAMKKHIDFVTTCPEVEIGLGVPREPIKIISRGGRRRLVQPATGLDFSERMDGFAKGYLEGLGEVDGFILKGKSPSCGLFDVKEFSGVDGGTSKGRKFSGFFGKKIMETYRDTPWEDEARLLNGEIRGCFFKKIFTLARFREMKKAGTMRGLVEFHERHKLLLMAFGQEGMQSLGRVAANRDEGGFREVAEEYEKGMRKMFGQGMCAKSAANVLLHSFGYFKKELSGKEKKFFLELLDGYRKGRVMLLAPKSLLWSWALRFNQEYLERQVFFEPYPKELVIAENLVYIDG